jgi:uncharacterized protein (DUF2141 family)
LFTVILAAAVSPPVLADDSVHLIELITTGAEPGAGQVLVSLFDSSETYLTAPLFEATAEVDDEGNASVSLGEHPPGEYAIAVIYDKNENGKLDTGLFRVPKERIGFSNNARGIFGPAKWDDARFSLTDTDAIIEIRLAKADR